MLEVYVDVMENLVFYLFGLVIGYMICLEKLTAKASKTKQVHKEK